MEHHVLEPEGARALCELTSRLMMASDAPEMAGEIAEIASDVVGAAYSQLGLLTGEGESLVLYHGADLDDRAQQEWPVVPLDVDTPVSRVVSSGAPLAVQSAGQLIAEYPVIRQATEASGYESLAVVPIPDPLQRRRRAGTLSAAWVERDRATDRALEILTDVADRCALALAKANRSASRVRGELGEREIVLALQQSLLPSLRVDHPHMDIASRYVASSDDLVVGGDWYDTVPLSDGRVAVAIGDVAGHGFEAAVAMGQFRNDFEALAAHHRGPDGLLEEIDRYAEKRDAPMTTVAVVYVDSQHASVTAVLAGHPPPILVRDGVAAILDHSLGPPLGIGLDRWACPPAVSSPILPGDTLVLYTDGVVERRGESIDRSIDRLRNLLESVVTGDPEALCDEIVDAMFGARGPRDDVALLVTRFL